MASKLLHAPCIDFRGLTLAFAEAPSKAKAVDQKLDAKVSLVPAVAAIQRPIASTAARSCLRPLVM